MKPMMNPSRTTRLLGNDGLAEKTGKHLMSAGAATNGNAWRASGGGIWNGDHPYATMGLKTSIDSGAAAFGFAGLEVANQPSWILFRLFAEYFVPARHKR